MDTLLFYVTILQEGAVDGCAFLHLWRLMVEKKREFDAAGWEDVCGDKAPRPEWRKIARKVERILSCRGIMPPVRS